MAFMAFTPFIDFTAVMVFIAFMVFMVLPLGLSTRRRIPIEKKHGTKMLGNDIGGLAGLVLGHPQVHARNGEDKHMGWQTNLLINMHGLD
jgi:hypothetical protein